MILKNDKNSNKIPALSPVCNFSKSSVCRIFQPISVPMQGRKATKKLLNEIPRKRAVERPLDANLADSSGLKSF